jgi:hypothetical protein
MRKTDGDGPEREIETGLTLFKPPNREKPFGYAERIQKDGFSNFSKSW